MAATASPNRRANPAQIAGNARQFVRPHRRPPVTCWTMDVPPPDAAKLLAHWMEWERGETPPGRVMSSLKTGGLRELLEALVADSSPAAGPASHG